MKQGRASKDGMAGVKREPIAHAVNPAGVDQMGQAMGNMVGGKRITSTPLYGGKGYEAPKGGKTIHHCGSQGKH